MEPMVPIKYLQELADENDALAEHNTRLLEQLVLFGEVCEHRAVELEELEQRNERLETRLKLVAYTLNKYVDFRTPDQGRAASDMLASYKKWFSGFKT